jgi:hypothetical protein
MARGVHSEAQQATTAARTSSTPTTLRKESCCPAKLAPGRSSAVAELRTATGPSSNAATSLTIRSRWVGEGFARENAAMIASDAASGSLLSASAMTDASPASATNASYSRVGNTTNGGTGRPASRSTMRLAPLPPR